MTKGSPEPSAPSSHARSRRFPGPKEILRAWLETTGFWSIAIAWPVFQRLDAGAETLTSVEARGLDLLVFVIIVMALVPTVLVGVESLLARLASIRAARVFHACVLGTLLGLVVWQILQQSPVLALIALIALAIAFAWADLRLELVRSFATFFSIATPVVLVLFLASYPIRAEVLPGKQAMDDQVTGSRTPVVMVVLDELPLAMLLDRQGELDTQLLPSLGRVARQTTWYPDALSVGDQTLSAMPAIMTGEDAASGEDRPPPGLPGYPDNLCTITAGAGYEVRAREVITDLCPRNSGPATRVTGLLRMGTVPTWSEGAKKPDRITPGGLLDQAAKALSGRWPQPASPWGFERAGIARGFIDGLDPGDRTFDLLHLILPHAPFQFLEDGRGYANAVIGDDGSRLALEDPESEAESLKNMQQALAQAEFTFALIADLIDRMKQLGVWERSLFVVAADHGASFGVGTSRRTFREQNSGWLLPVPMFIKYPGQSTGAVDRRPASVSDIAPTVLDALGLEPSPRASGSSLRPGRARSPRPQSIEVTSTDEIDFEVPMTLVETELRRAVALKHRGFGSGTLYAVGGRPELLGATAESEPGLEPLDASFQTDGPVIEVERSIPFLPAYVQAELPDVSSDPGTVAVAVNGVVAATTRAWNRDGTWMTGVNLPEGSFREGTNRITLYATD